MSASSCIFCKIAAGDIPCLRVMESSDALAYLDISPLAAGHTLLIPKKHFEGILDVPVDLAGSLARQVPKLAAAIMRATGATGLNVLQNTGQSSGQSVFHFHIHLIPRREGDGLGFRWNAGTYAEREGEAVLSKIRAELQH